MTTDRLFKPSRKAAISMLSEFIPNAGSDYSNKRNFDYGTGKHQSVSRLSPWLRHRLITEKEVVSAVLYSHSAKEAQMYLQEVFWRTYWKGWLEMRPQVWHQYQLDVQSLYQDEKACSECMAAVESGTGIECFDYWVRELTETGYLHNHARMWFASIWIFTLQLPWQLGADFFLQHLLDGDPASNTLSWRWVAGLQTKGKAYAASAENINKYTDGRFNPAGQLNECIEPLTEDHDFKKHELPVLANEAPAGSFGLLVHEEDLSPQILQNCTACQSIITLKTRKMLSPGGVSKAVSDFTSQCIDSAVHSHSYNIHTSLVCDEQADIQPVCDSIVQWCKDRKLNAVTWAYPPTGPTAAVLHMAKKTLRVNNIECAIIQSRWDKTIWPHADKGFFPLKKKIPQLLHDLDM